MKLKSMDSIELEINNIKNIESIKFSDVLLMPAGKVESGTYETIHEDQKNMFIPMLIVSYGEKTLVLTAFDKHFDFFVKKVKEVYLKEKDRPLPGFMTEHHIRIDDRSKEILLSETNDKTSSLYSFYKDKKSYEEPLLSKEKEIFGLLPLINYIIDTNATMFNKKYKSSNKLKGYGPRGNYVLFGEIDNIYTPIIIQTKKISNNTYKFDIGNVIDTSEVIEVKVSFKKTSLEITCKAPKYNYIFLESYRYDNGEMICTKESYVNAKLIFIKTNKFTKETEIPNISKIDGDDYLDWFKLPWKANLGFKLEEERINESTKTQTRKIQYIDTNKNVFINLESAEKRIKRRAEDFRLQKDLIFDDVDKTMVGYINNDITYISTTFGDNGALGEYKEKYAGKYFYHASSITEFEKLNKDNICPIGPDCDVYTQGDLLNNYKVKRKVMGN